MCVMYRYVSCTTIDHSPSYSKYVQCDFTAIPSYLGSVYGAFACIGASITSISLSFAFSA